MIAYVLVSIFLGSLRNAEHSALLSVQQHTQTEFTVGNALGRNRSCSMSFANLSDEAAQQGVAVFLPCYVETSDIQKLVSEMAGAYAIC